MGNVTMTLYTTAPGQQAIMAGPFELPRTGRTGRLPEAAFEVRPANSRAQVQFTAEVTVQVSLKGSSLFHVGKSKSSLPAIR
jgi:hypothetical protein